MSSKLCVNLKGPLPAFGWSPSPTTNYTVNEHKGIAKTLITVFVYKTINANT